MLIDNYNGLLTSVIRKHINPVLNYEEECISDVLFAIWENIEGFNDKENSFKNWICAIAKYISRISEELDSNLFYIDENLYKLELEEEINELLSSLNHKDKELFKRYYLDGDELEEIAMDTSTNVPALHSRLSRGRKKIRRSILKQESEIMKNKFEIFNKIKIDTDEYEEAETSNNEELKTK